VATAFGVFLVPGLFAMMERVGGKKAVSGEPEAVSGGGH